MYYVYILLCKDNTLYTGMTNNVQRRFLEHKNKRGGHYTSSHRAVKIVHKEEYSTWKEALKREKEIKSWRRGKKVRLIKFGKNKKKRDLFQTGLNTVQCPTDDTTL